MRGEAVLHEGHGNLLDADAEALVNTVNTVGVMGKGIALQFKRAYPEMFKAYAAACKRGEVQLGKVHVWPTDAMTGPRYIINFPTKGHWKARSKLRDVETGLVDLVEVVRELGVTSIAVPPLGCGHGGLRWSDVRPLIENAFESEADVDVIVYAPEATPAAADMATNTKRPNMTKGKAALVELVSAYGERAFEVSLIEVQKLMYFLQEAGEPLRLNYVKDRYGPYADNLRHSLIAVEGHFLTGFGDGSKHVRGTEPLEVLPGAVDHARRVLHEHPDTEAKIGRVLQLTDGFETAYGMELLATVHWVATRDDPTAVDEPDVAIKLVQSWSPRKKGLFTEDHIRLAWQQLRDQRWLDRHLVAS